VFKRIVILYENPNRFFAFGAKPDFLGFETPRCKKIFWARRPGSAGTSGDDFSVGMSSSFLLTDSAGSQPEMHAAPGTTIL
jgi:hypothetical protein